MATVLLYTLGTKTTPCAQGQKGQVSSQILDPENLQFTETDWEPGTIHIVMAVLITALWSWNMN